MVQHLIALGQPGLVQTLITIVTVATIEKEVAMLDVFLLAIGLNHQPARKVRKSINLLCFQDLIFRMLD